MSDTAAVLFANEAFYRAFAAADMAAMAAVWADDGPVSCIHPGRPALAGRAAVMASWRDILGAGMDVAIEMRGAQARVWGAVGVVLCYEVIGGQGLVATNIFTRGPAGWRMVHHQAGPADAVPARDAPPGAVH